MGDLELKRFSITDEQLSRMPKDDAVLLMQMAHLSNTLDALQKLFIYTAVEDDSEPLVFANITMHSLMARILAGTVFEAWQVLGRSFFETGLSKIYEPQLKEEGKRALDEVKKYFGEKTLIKNVRDKFAFHYDRDKILREIEVPVEGREHVFFIGPKQGESLFYAAEDIVGMAMLRSIAEDVGIDNVGSAFHVFNDEVTKVARDLYTLAHHCVGAIIGKHVGQDGFSVSTVTMTDIPKMDEVRIPYFVAPEKTMPF
jgi:hypothetical protein